MNAASLLLLLFLLPRAAAAPFVPGQALDQQMVASVTASAFAFVSPRALDPIPMAQLALWGLRGLTTLDPTLTTEAEGNAVTLTRQQHILFAAPQPGPEDAAGWGTLFGQFVRVAWDASEGVRHAGTGGVIRTCLNEMLDHFDPYSRYTPPDEAEQDRLRRAGSGGVGLVVTPGGGGFAVAGVAADSPAAKGGVHPGERILAIDGQSTQGADLALLKVLLSGPAGTQVVLSLRAPGGKPRDIILTRALVPPETVRASRTGALLVLRVSGFSSDTGARFAHEISRGLAGPHPPKGVVVDLRGNRGGLLRQAVAAAEALIASGPIVTTTGRDPDSSQDFLAHGTDLAHALPVVVLVDGRTASAAEILAAALADHGRAVVVGSSTFGKGLVQTIATLPDGGELLITWSRVLAPLGWPLQGLGVLPQVCTSTGEESVARQQDELAAGHSVMAHALEQQRRARAPVPPATALEIRNACQAADESWLDLSAASWLVDHPQAYAAALIPPQLTGSTAMITSETTATP